MNVKKKRIIGIIIIFIILCGIIWIDITLRLNLLLSITPERCLNLCFKRRVLWQKIDCPERIMKLFARAWLIGPSGRKITVT